MRNQLDKSEELLDSLRTLDLDAKSKLKFKRVLNIMSLGSLYGLNTLSQILSALHIKSNNLHKIWRTANYQQVQSFVKHFGEDNFKTDLIALAKKDDSAWSRAHVTIIADDSIFRQWLKNMPQGKEFAKFFSGQYHKTVYGFRVSLVGVALGDTFYPLYFLIVPKGECSKKAALKSLKKAHQLIKSTLDKQQLSSPNLSFSVDSGFSDTDLIDYCEAQNIRFIGVPKKNNKFQIGRYDLNLKNYIEKVFLKKEQQYLAKCKAKNIEPKPFYLRKKGFYQALGRKVTLVFFRLNDSKKVSVIFCNDLEVTAKFIRWRFFQRTKIEQFFRLLKDTLKIQQTKSVDAESFVKKLATCIFKAIVCQNFRIYCNKKFKDFKDWAFTKLRLHIIYDHVELDMLEQLVKNKGFCKKK